MNVWPVLERYAKLFGLKDLKPKAKYFYTIPPQGIT